MIHKEINMPILLIQNKIFALTTNMNDATKRDVATNMDLATNIHFMLILILVILNRYSNTYPMVLWLGYLINPQTWTYLIKINTFMNRH